MTSYIAIDRQKTAFVALGQKIYFQACRALETRDGFSSVNNTILYICALAKLNQTRMTNNDILKKLRVALKLRNDQILEILSLVNFKISPNELSALFRSEDHPNYQPCGDQILRNFLNGLIIHLRGPIEGRETKEGE